MSRVRYWSLCIVLIIYLVGVFILSAVTLHEPKRKGPYLKVIAGAHTTYHRGTEHGIPLYHSRLNKISWCSSELTFLKNAREPVALVSFPGSGNTWLRYLLQQATGILTGSVYKDWSLMRNGFPAESVGNGSVLVVKTHEFGPSGRMGFAKAILLVREPAGAIQAEFNRQGGGHTGFASPERYQWGDGKTWHQFVDMMLRIWKNTNLDWLCNFTGPIYVLFYEQLVSDVESSLRELLHFLDVPLNESRLKCTLERQEGVYRRKRKILNFDPYTEEMKKKLQKEKEYVYSQIFSSAT